MQNQETMSEASTVCGSFERLDEEPGATTPLVLLEEDDEALDMHASSVARQELLRSLLHASVETSGSIGETAAVSASAEDRVLLDASSVCSGVVEEDIEEEEDADEEGSHGTSGVSSTHSDYTDGTREMFEAVPAAEAEAKLGPGRARFAEQPVADVFFTRYKYSPDEAQELFYSSKPAHLS